MVCPKSSILAALVLSVAQLAKADACSDACGVAYNSCRSSDANRSTCASQYATCLGYVPFGPDGSLVTPTACSASSAAPAGPTVSAIASADSSDPCVKKCNDAWDACRTAPQANMAYCASQFAGCVGYNPFGDDGFVAPTACSAAASTPAVPTSMAVPTTMTMAAPTATAVSDPCLQKCNTEWDTCRTAPQANMAYCASQFAACVGYNPFAGDGFVAPTACSATAFTMAAPTMTSATAVQPSMSGKATPSVIVVAAAGRASVADITIAVGCALVGLALL